MVVFVRGRWGKNGTGEVAGVEVAGVGEGEGDCESGCGCDDLGGSLGPVTRECVRGAWTITSEGGAGGCGGRGS